MNHRLFIAEQVIGQTRILLQRLPNPGDVSVSEDSEAALKETRLPAVSLDILIREEGDGCLCDCQSFCHIT